MKFIKRLLARFGILKELLEFFWANKMWWMIPLVAVIIVFSAFLVFTQSSPLAPFIYVLF